MTKYIINLFLGAVNLGLAAHGALTHGTPWVIAVGVFAGVFCLVIGVIGLITDRR